jgi:UDP-N-acetylmuramate dehydrogenase
MIQEDDIVKMKNSIDKQNMNLNYNVNKQCRFCIKFVLSSLFSIIIFVIVTISIKNKKKELQILLSRKSIDNSQNEKMFLENLRKILDQNEILEDEMMNKHTTFELGGPAKFFIKPNSIDKIIKVLKLCKEYSIDYFILGNGSNLLVSDKGYDGLVINIHEENFSDLKVKQIDNINYEVTVGGGILMRTLAKRLCLLSLSGLEDIIDIPGTIGGGIIMNASAGFGTKLIYDSLYKVKVITPEGQIKELSKKECKLVHRGSLLKDKKYMVIEASFKLIKEDKMIIQKRMADHTSRRYSKQPMYFPSAGCFFVWFKPKFGSLYEKYKENNLVSYRIGDAMIYTHNIAFIVNLGSAKASDVYQIVIHVEKIFSEKYNIAIRREVIVLGSFS